MLIQCYGTTVITKSTEVQNPRCNKCSAVVEKNCLVAEYRVPYRIGPCTIIGQAGASPPSRTTGLRCLYIHVFMYLCIYPVRLPDTVNF